MSDCEITLYDPQTKSTLNGGLELLDQWEKSSDAWIWLNISGEPDLAEHKLLSERFGVPSLAIQDAQRERHSPKLEVFDHMIFVILRDLITLEEAYEHQVAAASLFIGENFLVSRHYHRVPAIEAVLDVVKSQAAEMQAGPAHIAYLVSRRLVDNYTPVVIDLEERLADLEDLVFEQQDDEMIELITRYNRSFKQLRRHLVNQRDVVAQLRHPTVKMPLKLSHHEFNDVYEHLDRLTSLCHLNQELAADLLSTHLNLVSHRLNHIMRLLTIATVIFLPLSLMAGIYGMNFRYMPELSWHYGYFALLGLMAVAALALIVLFKRRGWL